MYNLTIDDIPAFDTTIGISHNTQKPIPLLEKLIKIFTDEGDIVIDPVAGSGATLIAADNCKRRGFGFEIKKNFFTDATRLIKDAKIKNKEIAELGYAKTELNKINKTLF